MSFRSQSRIQVVSLGTIEQNRLGSRFSLWRFVFVNGTSNCKGTPAGVCLTQWKTACNSLPKSKLCLTAGMVIKKLVLGSQKMLQKQFMYWCQKCLRLLMARIAIRVVVMIFLTAGILGIWVSDALALVPTYVALNTQLASTATQIQDEQTAPYATVYRSPECTCCGGWIKHLKAQGFRIKDFPTPDIDLVKQKYHVPDNLTSCHTAIVNGHVIEGHVPADDIKRLLQDSPNTLGLSVPQMPVGTPGMEMGNQKDPFSVFSFDRHSRIAVYKDYP